MTPDEVAQLKDNDEVRASLDQRIVRGRINTMPNFIRVDWLDNFRSYDILRRTSPLWKTIEREPRG